MFPIQLLTTSRIDNLTRFIHNLLCVCYDHTYINILIRRERNAANNRQALVARFLRSAEVSGY